MTSFLIIIFIGGKYQENKIFTMQFRSLGNAMEAADKIVNELKKIYKIDSIEIIEIKAL
jgi:hypothetical protein